MEYHQLAKKESSGSYGSFGITINVATSKPVVLESDAIYAAVQEAQDLVEAAVMASVISLDEKAQEHAALERKQLIDLFTWPIFVEPIPNGYCPRWCCKHLPWFIVTTAQGRFKIGCRKRVISIDWSETRCKADAETLFPDEDVTKKGKSMHAWSLEKAKEYINKVMETAATEV